MNSYVSAAENSEAKVISEDELKLIEQAFTNLVQDSYSRLSDHGEYQERVYTEICRLWKDNSRGLRQV